jgi:hypothetical protein
MNERKSKHMKYVTEGRNGRWKRKERRKKKRSEEKSDRRKEMNKSDVEREESHNLKRDKK